MLAVIISDTAPSKEYLSLVQRPAGKCAKSSMKAVCEGTVFANSKHRARLEVQALALNLIALCNSNDPARRLSGKNLGKQFVLRYLYVFRFWSIVYTEFASGQKHIVWYFHSNTSPNLLARRLYSRSVLSDRIPVRRMISLSVIPARRQSDTARTSYLGFWPRPAE